MVVTCGGVVLVMTCGEPVHSSDNHVLLVVMKTVFGLVVCDV